MFGATDAAKIYIDILTMAEPYTTDDRTLLRAIDKAEGRTPQQAMGSDVDGALQELIIDRPQFQVIKDNQHLRALLRAFLEANIAVERVKSAISKRQSVPRLLRIFQMDKTDELEDQLKVLEPIRDQAFKDYEMLRKLTDNENVLLRRYPG